MQLHSHTYTDLASVCDYNYCFCHKPHTRHPPAHQAQSPSSAPMSRQSRFSLLSPQLVGGLAGLASGEAWGCLEGRGKEKGREGGGEGVW
jgi:hypothetical protein